MGQNNEFGKEGEELAVAFLSKKGYQIIEQNYRYRKAEVDIIAKKDRVLAFVEVKSRRSNYTERIADTVSKKKIKLLVMAADHYLIANEVDLEARFDIITILKNKQTFELTHLENAFYHF